MYKIGDETQQPKWKKWNEKIKLKLKIILNMIGTSSNTNCNG